MGAVKGGPYRGEKRLSLDTTFIPLENGPEEWGLTDAYQMNNPLLA